MNAKPVTESAEAKRARLEEGALDAIAGTQDPAKLRRLRDAGRREGSARVEEAAFRRLVSVLPAEGEEGAEREFWRTIHVFEELLSDERGRTTRLSRTRQKIARVGEMRALADFATARDTGGGFDTLVERDLPELTGEAIVLRHRGRFGAEVVEAAEARLRGAGVDVEALPDEV